jgi:puromycin-sensitive aminopeptidase
MQGGEAEFEAMLARFRSPATPQEENRYLYALASFDDEAFAVRAFDLALGEVRTQNAPFLVQALLVNRVTGPSTWHRVVAAWDTLENRFPSNIFPRMLDGVRALCTPPELAAEVTRFIEAHPVAGSGRSLEQTLERLSVNVTFATREGAGLAAVLTGVLDLPTG